jgi:DNA-binding NtrC family response regulator
MNKHILLIVKEEDGQELRRVLENQGYSPILVSSVELFDEMEISFRISLVIIDLDLPMVSNFFVSHLKKKTRAWIIGISSGKFHPHLEEALRTDLFSVVSKPIDYSELFYCMKCLEDEKEQSVR